MTLSPGELSTLADAYDFKLRALQATKKEKTLMGLLGGIDVIATMIKK